MEDDGMIFAVGEDGTLTEYEEPYSSIECPTEEDYNRLVELLKLGKNVDKLGLTRLYSELKEKQMSYENGTEKHTNEYKCGHTNGQIELLEKILNINLESEE